jgi:hypothetical protein
MSQDLTHMAATETGGKENETYIYICHYPKSERPIKTKSHMYHQNIPSKIYYLHSQKNLNINNENDQISQEKPI